MSMRTLVSPNDLEVVYVMPSQDSRGDRVGEAEGHYRYSLTFLIDALVVFRYYLITALLIRFYWPSTYRRLVDRFDTAGFRKTRWIGYPLNMVSRCRSL